MNLIWMPYADIALGHTFFSGEAFFFSAFRSPGLSS